MKKALVSALFAAVTIGPLALLPSAAAVDVYVNIAPPAPRYEAVPAHRPGYVWTPGHWQWNANRGRYYWTGGYWVRARHGYAYSAPRWVEREGRWLYQPRRWDSDRDGIPDRRDPTPYGGGRPEDRDGDGVPNHRDARPNDPARR